MAVVAVAITVSAVNCTWSEHSFLPSAEEHCRNHALVDSLHIAADVAACNFSPLNSFQRLHQSTFALYWSSGLLGLHLSKVDVKHTTSYSFKTNFWKI